MAEGGKQDEDRGRRGYLYNDEEAKFLAAVEKFRQKNHRLPRATDYLHICLDLGYRKADK